MKRVFADLIHLLCHCGSYHQKISLPGAQTGKRGACKAGANGILQVLSHLVFTSHLVTFSNSHPQKPLRLYQFSKGRCFLGARLPRRVWYNPSPFLNRSIRAHGGLDFQVQAQRSEKMLPLPELSLGAMLSITVLPGDLGPVSHVWALICPTYITKGTLPLPRASSVHSAEGDASGSDSDLLLGKSCLGSVSLRVGCVRNVGSSEWLHEARWTWGQLSSTKQEDSFASSPALPCTVCEDLAAPGRLCSSTLGLFTVMNRPLRVRRSVQ